MYDKIEVGKILSTFIPYVFSKNNYNGLKMAAATAIDLTVSAINVAAPMVIANNLNTYSKDQPISSYWPSMLSVSAITLAQLLPKVSKLITNDVRTNVQKELAAAMIEKAYDLELDLHLTTRTGDFMQALSKNYTSVDRMIPSVFNEAFPVILEALACAALLSFFYGEIGYIEFVILINFLLFTAIGENLAHAARVESTNQSTKSFGDILETVQNYQNAKLFGNSRYELDKVSLSLLDSEKAFNKTYVKEDVTAILLSAINGIGFVGSLIFTALRPPHGSFNLKDFAVIAYYLTRFNANLTTLPGSISTINTALIDSQKLVNFLSRESTVSDIPNAKILQLNNPPFIEFKNVSFSYGNKIILDNVSFTIPPGKKISVVGATGVGKSTLINLLLRFYPLDSGKILINGHDITALTAESIRSYMAVVSQGASLFNDTIAANIHYGDLSSQDYEVVQAAQLAELIKENTSRLQDPVGQKGGLLSGGEIQRTGIARALLKQSPVFLLDEPTSALDAKTEREVQGLLDSLTQNASTLLITHRLHTTYNSDCILYLHEGKIVEAGNFDELMNKKGYFYTQLNVLCEEMGINISSIKPIPKQAKLSKARDNFWNSRNKNKILIEDTQSLDIQNTDSDSSDSRIYSDFNV
ncbi:MAG: ABC transporter ATP-binding protein [Tatlockia sp.]|nr:ABC transporter ATP-binding protein [Tatlockia sp.]